VDEPIERLGERLMLPPQYEPGRAAIERALPPLSSEKLGPETSAFADRPDSSLESPGP
jgi:hypothetical protein